MEVVNKEVAQNDVNDWLDAKKISSLKRTKQSDSIETLIGAIQDGCLILNEDKTFTQKLKFPIDGIASELKYKNRISQNEISVHLQNIKSNDIDGRVNGYLSGLTSLGSSIIKKVDTEDLNIAHSIVAFFL